MKSQSFFNDIVVLDKRISYQNIREKCPYLDLAKCVKRPVSDEERVALLIRSLHENYISYGKQRVSKEKTSFYIVPRISIPPMRSDSTYMVWQKFVNQVAVFLDGTNRTPLILELYSLQNKFKAISSNAADTIVLEQILSDFETKAGFLTTVDITPYDGINGLLSDDEFKKILAAGHPINDFGTTPQHGALPHRLQFYLLGNYFIKNIFQFFTPEDLKSLINSLSHQYPDRLDKQGRFPASNIISVFYRLLGTNEFNNCFDWNEFFKEREQLTVECNKRNIPEEFNKANIWVQLFDRYGYAGFFSVPSTAGLLQKLGCFSSLPTIGVPNIKVNRDLKTIFDVTPQFTR